MQFLISVGIFLGMTLIPATRAPVTQYPTSNAKDEIAQFSLTHSRVTLHEPIVMAILIKNDSGTDIQLDLGQDRKENFLFSITLPTGQRIALPRLKKSGLSRVGRIRLRQGESYSQHVLLNQWYQFESEGRYEIEARLARPIVAEDGRIVGGQEPFHETLEIESRDEAALAKVYDSLANEIEGSNSYEEASEAALELSYARDAIAVPYLQRVLKARKLVEPIAISGLERIGNREAVRDLTLGLQISDNNIGMLARAALQRLEDSTRDPAIRKEIMDALNRGSNPHI